jgi:hypothetical protein
MTVQAGGYVRPTGQTAWYHDDTILANLTNTSYDAGTVEVGVFFIAPTSGRVRVTIGGGVRDNGASALDRVLLAVQLFLDDRTGSEILAPTVTTRGYGGAKENSEFQYGSRVFLLENLDASSVYYLRVMHQSSSGVDPDTADIAARDVIVIPVN